MLTRGWGYTALHCAAHNDCLKIMRDAVSRGEWLRLIKIQADRSKTCLHHAVLKGSPDSVTTILGGLDESDQVSLIESEEIVEYAEGCRLEDMEEWLKDYVIQVKITLIRGSGNEAGQSLFETHRYNCWLDLFMWRLFSY